MDPNFNNLTDIQQKIHGVEVTNGNYKIDSVNRPTFFMGSNKEKFSYYSIDHEVMNMVEMNKLRIRFAVSMTHNWLQAIEYRQKWPELRVKDEYLNQIEIAWTHNPGTNCFSKMEVRFNNSKNSFSMDNAGIDTLNAVLRTKNRRSFQKRIGNFEEMEGWSHLLYEYTTNPILPLWITRGGTASALPLFYFANMNPVDTVLFDFEPRNEITKLLRMRKLVSKEGEEPRWEVIKPDLRYITGYANPPILQAPELIAYYMDTLPDEVDETLSQPLCSPNKPFIETYKIEDMITIDVDNTYTYGQTASHKPSTEHPARMITALAENLESKEFNLHSNYTTDPHNVYSGYYPIREVRIRNEKNNAEKVYDLQTIESMMELLLKKTPTESGYFSIFKTIRPTELEESNGISLSNNDCKISVVLDDTTLTKDGVKNQKFAIKIRILVSRFINFQYDFINKKYKWTIDSTNI